MNQQDGKEDYRADARRNAPPPVWNERQGKKGEFRYF